MPVINVIKEFKYSEDGNHVVIISIGKQDVSDKCADIAVNQLKVAEIVEEKKKATTKK